MQPFQQRVVDEKAELDARRKKLMTFTMADIFKALPEDDQLLLKDQLDAMDNYSRILESRIRRFT